MDTTTTSNWRDQLQPETRQIILNNIMGKLKFCHLPGDVDEDLELQKIAHSIEQKSYGGATTQADYFEKIASKILLLEKAREREWRYQLRPDCRQRIVNKIMELLKRHLPVSGPEGSQELSRIARRFEEKIFIAATQELWRLARRFEEESFIAATSQSDYVRKISLKLLRIKTTSQGQGRHGQLSNQLGLNNEPANPEAREREWRSQLRPDSRQRMVNRIRETLRRHLPVSGPEGSQELWKIARRFEEKIFAAASSQTDYRRKIYLKVFTIMETMYQGSQEPANPAREQELKNASMD